MKKFTLLTLLLIASLSLLTAVIADFYQGPVESAGTYSAITGTAAGVTGDDYISAALNIGFTFNYCGSDYTQVKMSTNGWLGIGTAQTGSNLTNALASTSVLPVIAPLWDDLHSDGMSYTTLGSEPNRVFVAQWANSEWNYSGTAGQNFQVRLYEGSNKIELIYGTMITPNSPSASIGINMSPGGSGNYYSITPGAPMTWSTTTENSSISAITYLTSGTTYTFNQTVATAQPNPAALIAPGDGVTGVSLNPTLSWMSGGGLPTDYNVYLDTLPNPVTLVSPNQTGTTYNPATLAFNTTYYWKVDPHNAFGYASELHTLPVWSFTTASPPLSGTKIIGTTTPYDYLSFTAAINDLNGSGVSATGVTFQVQDGTYVENPPPIMVGGGSGGAVVFEPVTGANPVLTPTGGTGSFGFKVDAADYVTFDGIDISNPDGTLVYGYWFINGTDYITVQNSIITMPYVSTTNYAIRSYGTNNNCSFLGNTIASNTYYGIYVYGVSGAEAQNNVVQGNVLSGIRNYGIYNYYAYNTEIAYNTVACMAGNTNAFYGIYNASTTTSANIHHNEISGGSSSSAIYPIYVTAGATINIYSNKIHNFEYTGTSTSIVYGIYISGGTTVNTYNNMVYDLRSPAGTSAPQIRAIAIGGGTTLNLWNNTVYLNASGSAAGFATAAMYISSTTPTVDLRNNIFVNKSTPGTTGRTVALWKTSAGVATLSATTDKNIYYAGAPDATHLIGYFSTTAYPTLAEYQGMALTKDQGSYTEDVPFVSDTRIIDLHIDPLVMTRVEGNAIPIQPPVTHDIDGDERDPATPDIGADEGEFTPVGGAPGLVTLLNPADGADVDPNALVLSWAAPTQGGTPTQYWVFIAESETEFWDTQIGYAEVDVPATSLDLSTVAGVDLEPLTPYYWAVQAHNDEGESDPEDPGFMIWEFNTIERMTAQADLALGNVWPEDPITGTIPVTNHGPVELTFDASGPDEFEFGTTRFTVPRNSSYELPYTYTPPATLGAYTGTVVLQQTSPDAAADPLNVAVTANVTTDVIVGTGTVDLDLPVNIFYGYTYSQTIYYPSELNYPAGYRIEKLYYNFNGNESCESTKDWVIWMGHTTENTFASTTSWLPVTGLTQVYAGENQPQQVTGGYWMEFTLNSPFIYDGVSNLVIAVDENTPGYDTSSSYFYCTNTTGVNRSIRYYSDTTNPDPATPPTGTLIAGHPNTKFFVAPIPTTPQIAVNPEAKDFGTVIINTEPVQQFSIANTGAGTLSISSITYDGDSYFQLQNLPAEFPVNLLYTDPAATFEVKYLPTVVGTHSGTVTITDNRGITTIELDGVCVDPRIASLPHSENFDGVATPNLPLGWTGYKGNAGMSIYTSTGYAQTTPNSVYMYNSSYTTDALRLISPQVLVPMNSYKVSFQALTGTSNSTLKLGTVSALDGTGVFTEIATVTIPTTYTWTPFTVSFAAYAGTDQYLCFQHGNQSTYQSIYVDTVLLEELLANDLAATALVGPGYGNVGDQLSYDVSVYNNGTATQNAYTVKLMKTGTREELAYVDVTTPLDPGATATHTILWTPGATQAGSVELYGKVVLTGDGNPANDETALKAALILPAGTYIPLVGDPLSTTTANTLPLNFFWKNSVSETIYTALEMQMTAGDILGIAYFNNFTQNLAGKPVKIWAKNTTATDLSTGWLDFTGYTQVFDGVIDFPTGANTIIIPFSAPFAYTGGNLALRVNRPLDTVYFNSTNTFYYTVPQYGLSRSYELHSDSDTIDPTNPVQGSSTYGGLLDNIPVTAFLATNAVPVVLAEPVVTVTQTGTDAVLNWAAVPGAYAYRVYASNDPYDWDPNAAPIAVVWTNSYSAAMADPYKFYKVVAVSSYRQTNGLTNNPATNNPVPTLKAEAAVGRTDNK